MNKRNPDFKTLPFINSEIAVPTICLNKDGTPNFNQLEKTPPAIIISFGDVEGPIEDRFLSIADARSLVIDIVNNLAALGDPTAQSMVQEYFQ